MALIPTETSVSEIRDIVRSNASARRASEKRVERLMDALRQADLAMKNAQWGTSHPARLAIAKALSE